MSDEINKEEQISQKKKSFFSSTKSRVILTVVIVIFAIIAIKGIALARHFHRFADGPHGFIIEKISENLNLTPEQKAHVEKISDQIKQKMEAKKSTRENMLDEFANEFKKDNMDRNKLKELSVKKDQEKQEMKDFMMDKIIEFHDLLTPDQRNKAVETMKEMKGKFHDKMKKFKDRQD